MDSLQKYDLHPDTVTNRNSFSTLKFFGITEERSNELQSEILNDTRAVNNISNTSISTAMEVLFEKAKTANELAWLFFNLGASTNDQLTLKQNSSGIQ